MTNLTQIKELADNEFTHYLENLHKNYPELILKYQITMDMKTEFIEAALQQFWEQKEFNMNEVLESTVYRYKSLKRGTTQ